MPLTAIFLALTLSYQGTTTYGKSDEQVLAMGQDKWFAFYTKHAGDSTAAMTSAYGIYGDIAARRNDRAIQRLQPQRKKIIVLVRKELHRYTNDLTGIGQFLTGGGTMWHVVGSQNYAQVEDLTYGFLNPLGADRGHRPSISAVQNAVRKFRDPINKAAKENDASEVAHKEAITELEEALSALDRLAGVLPTLRADEAGRIVTYCMQLVKDSESK